MTVAVYKSEYRAANSAGTLDMDGTVAVLRAAEGILDRAVAAWDANAAA